MDPHGALPIMDPVRILRNLQAQALIPHGVVLGPDLLEESRPWRTEDGLATEEPGVSCLCTDP